jgi:hypothetical protein
MAAGGWEYLEKYLGTTADVELQNGIFRTWLQMKSDTMVEIGNKL